MVSHELVPSREDATLHRRGGDHLVIAGIRGRTHVQDPTATWARTLEPDYVLVIEGEDDASIRVAADSDAQWLGVHIRSVDGYPMRWVP